jgi:hypothetical protein
MIVVNIQPVSEMMTYGMVGSPQGTMFFGPSIIIRSQCDLCRSSLVFTCKTIVWDLPYMDGEDYEFHLKDIHLFDPRQYRLIPSGTHG